MPIHWLSKERRRFQLHPNHQQHQQSLSQVWIIRKIYTKLVELQLTVECHHDGDHLIPLSFGIDTTVIGIIVVNIPNATNESDVSDLVWLCCGSLI